MTEQLQFGRQEPFTIGVEEELFVVDPTSGELRNGASQILEALDDPGPGHVKSEVHACQIELITEVCATVGEALDSLAKLQGSVVGAGAAVIGSGTHPSAEEGDAEITDKDRYELIGRRLGDAIATPVGAIHVHVGMPDADYGDQGVQRNAPPSAAARGTGRQLSFSPRPRHRTRFGP